MRKFYPACFQRASVLEINKANPHIPIAVSVLSVQKLNRACQVCSDLCTLNDTVYIVSTFSGIKWPLLCGKSMKELGLQTGTSNYYVIIHRCKQGSGADTIPGGI